MNSNLFTSRQTEVDNIKKEIFTVENRKSIFSENTRTKSISNNKRLIRNSLMDTKNNTPIKRANPNSQENESKNNHSFSIVNHFQQKQSVNQVLVNNQCLNVQSIQSQVIGKIREEGSNNVQITNCQLTDKDLKLILQGFKSSHVLSVNLQNNHLGNEALKYIYQYSKINKALREVNLHNNGVDPNDGQVKAILKHLQSSKVQILL